MPPARASIGRQAVVYGGGSRAGKQAERRRLLELEGRSVLVLERAGVR